MNRLILIGNGFDLAHGIKTSFNDFITDYFCNAVNSAFEKNSYKDILLDISFYPSNLRELKIQNPATKDTVYDGIKELIKSKYAKFEFKSLLLSKVYDRTSNLKWVDIEVEFFNVLLDAKRSSTRDGEGHAIKKVNEELEYLKDKLIEYLTIQENKWL